MFKVGDKVVCVLDKDLHLRSGYIIKKYNTYTIGVVNKYGSFQLKEVSYYTFNLYDHSEFFEHIIQFRKRKIEKIEEIINVRK
jgi:hypothetical protein